MPRTLPRRAPVANGGSYQPSSEEDEVEVTRLLPVTGPGPDEVHPQTRCSARRLQFLSSRELLHEEAAKLISTSWR